MNMIRYDNRYNDEFDADPEGDWVPYEVANELLQALKIAQTALGEMKHAHFNPNWFTHGKDGATQQFLLWQRKGSKAVNDALLKAEGLDEPKD